jgi:bacteriocin biosynthesis cyclodehydratase domain-containing protein
MHPLLTPGTHVLRRGDGGVQLGLAVRHPVRLAPDEADADALSPHQGSPALASADLRERLVERGLAAHDDGALRAALPADTPENRWQRHTVAALFADDPRQLPARTAERTSKRFRVRGFGHPLDDALREDLLTLLRRAGLTPAGPKPPGPPPRNRPATEPVLVLLGVGEPRRDLTDPLMREAIPHLVVRLREGEAVVGPFVLPGLTPCLRCLDSHLADEDPSWPLLVQQYALATRSDRADGVPEPVDAPLAAAAVAWAARELAAYAEGRAPATLGRTVTLAARGAEPETRPWWPHPRCGCGWSCASGAPVSA